VKLAFFAQDKSTSEMIAEQALLEKRKEGPVGPLSSLVAAEPHTAVYKMHRYYARRPHNVFAHLIKHYTKPGDVILDPFCGGGVTIIEGLRLRRKVIGVDLVPLATFITRMEVTPVDLKGLESAFDNVWEEASKALRPLYLTDSQGDGNVDALAEWYEWSNVIRCPYCEDANVLAEAKKLRAGVYSCNNKECRAELKPSECKRLPDQMIRVQWVKHETRERGQRMPSCYDLTLTKEIDQAFDSIIAKEDLEIPTEAIPDADRQRDDFLFEKGITQFSQLFTKRNLIATGRLKKIINNCKCARDIKEFLSFAFSGALRFTNKMVFRNPGWQAGKPIEWAQHAYWLPNVYIENNALLAFINRKNAIMRGKRHSNSQIGAFYEPAQSFDDLSDDKTCMILTRSSDNLSPLPNESIDVIITDPPYGGSVQYSELCDFWVVWLKDVLNVRGVIDNSKEAIETRHRGFPTEKTREHYEEMLAKVFMECRRVLKKDGWMVLTFHNRDLGVWMTLHRAALRAGFRLPLPEEDPQRGMLYQPPIQIYTSTIHQRAAGAMLGDFILSFKKLEKPVEVQMIHKELTGKQMEALCKRVRKIIEYNGGADESTLYTGLIPYLNEQGLYHHFASVTLSSFFKEHGFIDKKEGKNRKWYTPEMIDEETQQAKVSDMVPAEEYAERIVWSYLKKNKLATMDQLLNIIYTKLVNSQRPGLNSISKVLNKLCGKPCRVRGIPREVFALRRTTASRAPFDLKKPHRDFFEETQELKHDDIIVLIAESASWKGYIPRVGDAEQRKSKKLREISGSIGSHMDYGLSPDAFSIIRQIDLLLIKGQSFVWAVEVATTIETLGKAINERFRNLLAVIPNIQIRLVAIVRSGDYQKARKILETPANRALGLPQKVRIVDVSSLKAFLEEL
jgi:putative DNA methylase